MPITRSNKMLEADLLLLQTQLTEKERKLRDDQEKLENEKLRFLQQVNEGCEHSGIIEQLQEENTRLKETLARNENSRKSDVDRARCEVIEELRKENLQLKETLSRKGNSKKPDEERAMYNIIEQMQREISVLREGQARIANNTITTASMSGQNQSLNSLPFAGSCDALRENQLKPRDAAEVVPKFNGNNISVFQFARTCERARAMLPPSAEFCLVQIIMNKLYGHALQIVQDTDFHTVAGLLNHLKRIFASPKTTNQYRGELGNVYQYPRESVFDYIKRITELRTALLDCERQTRGNVPIAVANEIESDVLNSFVAGLAPQVQIRLNIQKYDDFLDATIKAIQISKKLEIENQRHRGNRSETFNQYEAPRPLLDMQIPRPPPNPQNSRPNYNNGNQSYANSLNPHAAPYQPRNTRQWQTNKNTGNPKVCSYCNNLGHTREECRKLEWRTSQTNNQNTQNLPSTSGVDRNSRNVNFLKVPTEPSEPPELQKLDWTDRIEKPQ